MSNGQSSTKGKVNYLKVKRTRETYGVLVDEKLGAGRLGSW
jgi:hypothetical protein